MILSYEMAVEQLTQIADAQALEHAVEDFDYFNGYGFEPGADCEYSDGNRPLCIIGVWLHKVYGQSNDFLVECYSKNADDIAVAAGIRIDERTMYFLNSAQSNQDQALGWKESVKRASEGNNL